MKRIEVKEQVRLGFAKVCELCISGIKYRLFRSAVTVATVALAVTFLMTMLSQSMIRRNVGQAVKAEVAPQQWYDAWLNRLSKPLTHEELQQLLRSKDMAGYEDRLAEVRQWGGLTDEQVEAMVRVAEQEKLYMDYLESQRDSVRSLLLGPEIDRGWIIFEALARPARMEDFQQYWSSRPADPEFLAGLAPFVEAWNEQKPLREAVLAGQAESVRQLRQRLAGRGVEQILAAPSEADLALLADSGYVVDMATLEQLSTPAQLSLTMDEILQLRNLTSIRVHLAQQANVAREKVTDRILFSEARSADGAEGLLQVVRRERDAVAETVAAGRTLAWLLGEEGVSAGQLTEIARAAPEDPRRELLGALAYVDLEPLQEELASRAGVEVADLAPEHVLSLAAQPGQAQALAGVLEENRAALDRLWTEMQPRQAAQAERLARLESLTASLDPSKMVEAAKSRLRQNTLRRIEAKLAGEDSSGPLGFGRRTIWLIAVSFLVCAVGIANAMLMSVTERFREIATMKCLGAMDGVIMVLFVLESCLQGVAGGLAGAGAGLLLGVLQGWAEFGSLAFGQFPLAGVLACMGVSLVAGVMLAAMAAVYPAWVASRMAPMEAMRVE